MGHLLLNVCLHILNLSAVMSKSHYRLLQTGNPPYAGRLHKGHFFGCFINGIKHTVKKMPVKCEYKCLGILADWTNSLHFARRACTSGQDPSLREGLRSTIGRQ